MLKRFGAPQLLEYGSLGSIVLDLCPNPCNGNPSGNPQNSPGEAKPDKCPHDCYQLFSEHS
jgi:hypothetical protein